jgi:hypothetical protein
MPDVTSETVKEHVQRVHWERTIPNVDDLPVKPESWLTWHAIRHQGDPYAPYPDMEPPVVHTHPQFAKATDE